MAIFFTIAGLFVALYLSAQTDRKLEKSLAANSAQLRETLQSNTGLVREILEGGTLQLRQALEANNQQLNLTLAHAAADTTLALKAIRDQTEKVLSTYSDAARESADRTERALTKMENLWTRTHELVQAVSHSTTQVEKDFSNLQNFMSELRVASATASGSQRKLARQVRPAGASNPVQAKHGQQDIIKQDVPSQLEGALAAAMAHNLSKPIAIELLRQMWQEQGKYRMLDIREMQYPHYADAIQTYIDQGVLEERQGLIHIAPKFTDSLARLFEA